MREHQVIVILGPTASGKSALGIKLAKKFHGVIISADSRQVYRDMDLGTGKVTEFQQRQAPHYMLDVASPRRQYSVAHFVRHAQQIIARLPTDQPIFVVGGSPFYIHALLEPNSFSEVPPNEVLRRRLEKLDTASLMTRLHRIDPTRAKNIDPANRRRLIRAIEIASAPKSKQILTSYPKLNILKIGLFVPNKRLFQLIDRRLDIRLQAGMISEIKKLHAAGVPWNKMEAFGLEYRYVSRYLRGLISRPEMINQLQSATHDFARRQMTWWRKEKDIRWIKKIDQAFPLAAKFLHSK